MHNFSRNLGVAAVAVLSQAAGVLTAQDINNPFGSLRGASSREAAFLSRMSPETGEKGSKYSLRALRVELDRQVKQTHHDIQMDGFRHKQELRTARLEDFKHRTESGRQWLAARGDRQQMSNEVQSSTSAFAPARATTGDSMWTSISAPTSASPRTSASGVFDRTTEALRWPEYFHRTDYATERRFLDHCAAKAYGRSQALSAAERVALQHSCDLLLARLNADAKTLAPPAWLEARQFLTDLNTFVATL